MAKKKHEEEHENLERWLVSYSDFITLLFATFVVLYALAQIDVAAFDTLQKSLQEAFSAPSILQGQSSMLEGENASLDAGGLADKDSVVPPIMEQVNQKYEQSSFEEMQAELQAQIASGELKNVEIAIEERGLIIKLKDSNIFFESGTAILTPPAYKALTSIGEVIKSKFSNHLIRVEGHTDNIPSRGMYPSNWELSSARSSSVIRFLISNFKFKPQLFSAIGYADIKPLVNANTEHARQQNRRVEIVVLKNKYAKLEPNNFALILQTEKVPTVVTQNKNIKMSDAAKKLMLEHSSGNEDIIMIETNEKKQELNLYNEMIKLEDIKNQKIDSLSKSTSNEEKHAKTESTKKQGFLDKIFGIFK